MVLLLLLVLLLFAPKEKDSGVWWCRFETATRQILHRHHHQLQRCRGCCCCCCSCPLAVAMGGCSNSLAFAAAWLAPMRWCCPRRNTAGDSDSWFLLLLFLVLVFFSVWVGTLGRLLLLLWSVSVCALAVEWMLVRGGSCSHQRQQLTQQQRPPQQEAVRSCSNSDEPDNGNGQSPNQNNSPRPPWSTYSIEV